jgi:hypothetical protein
MTTSAFNVAQACAVSQLIQLGRLIAEQGDLGVKDPVFQVCEQYEIDDEYGPGIQYDVREVFLTREAAEQYLQLHGGGGSLEDPTILTVSGSANPELMAIRRMAQDLYQASQDRAA